MFKALLVTKRGVAKLKPRITGNITDTVFVCAEKVNSDSMKKRWAVVPTVWGETSIDWVYDCCFVLVGLFGLVLLPYSFGSG